MVRTVVLWIAALLMILLSGSVGAAPPRNVLLFIGDGMGAQHLKAAGMYAYGAAGTLSFEALPHQAMMRTYAADATVTDSAASGTAMATGHKVNNAVISAALPGDGSELQTMLEFFQDVGKSTGLVTTTEATHATPAEFGAHEPSRNNRTQIGRDYLTQTRPNVLFGGADNGLTTMQVQNDGGYAMVTDRAQMKALDTENTTHVVGLFGTGHLPYEYDFAQGTDTRYRTLPHLREMTATALAILDNDPEGFFLMVEGGRIDHAGHMANADLTLKTGRSIFETIEFANAVQVALDWAAGRDDTLIIVTADHETGDLRVTETHPQAGVLPAVRWGSRDHTAMKVPFAAIGPNADTIMTVMDNTDVFGVATADIFEPTSVKAVLTISLPVLGVALVLLWWSLVRSRRRMALAPD